MDKKEGENFLAQEYAQYETCREDEKELELRESQYLLGEVVRWSFKWTLFVEHFCRNLADNGFRKELRHVFKMGQCVPAV